MTDVDLLRQFVLGGDQNAFRLIVERHVDMVYAAAARQCSDFMLAEDVTQAVFMVLARKAAKVDGRTLPGWLVKTARNVAMEARRGERRRKARELRAASMRTPTETAEQWNKMSVVLDDALTRLGERDRTVVTMRYLQGEEIAEIATATCVSESAAARRLSRAVVKLRRMLARRGSNASVSEIGPLLLGNAKITCPPGLAGRIVNLGTGASGAAAVTTTAGLLAHAALTSSIFGGISSIGFTAAALVAISVSVTAIGITRHWSLPAFARSQVIKIPVEAVAGPAPSNPTTNQAPIRVGVLLSQFTANGPHLSSTPYGYKDGYLQTSRTLRTDPQITLIPIVEPGSASDPNLIAILKSSFKGKPPCSGIDVAQLSSLDVIVCPRIWNAVPEVTSAIEATVRSGKGMLVWAGFGVESPGVSPQINRLNGMTEGIWAMNSQPVDCRVMTDHPLLGSLKIGDVVQLEPNGDCGILRTGAIGLVRVDNPADVYSARNFMPISPDYVFYPLIVSNLGNGRVIDCEFTAWKPVPQDLQKATAGRFLIRCVRWLANRALD